MAKQASGRPFRYADQLKDGQRVRFIFDYACGQRIVKEGEIVEGGGVKWATRVVVRYGTGRIVRGEERTLVETVAVQDILEVRT